MATAVEPRKRSLTPESRFVIYGVGWKGYETLRRQFRAWVRDELAPRLAEGQRNDDIREEEHS